MKNKIIAISFLVLNTVFLWISTKISHFIVSLYRLDEARDYTLTQEEEMKIFFTHGIILFIIQAFILLMITAFFKINQSKNSTILLNLAVHSILFLWFVFKIYRFTISGE